MLFNNNTIVSLIHVFIVFIILGFGGVFVILPWTPNICSTIAEVLLYRSEVFLWVGISFLVIGFLFLCHFLVIHSFNYLRIHTKPFFCDIKPIVIEKAIKAYFKENKYKTVVDIQVFALKNKKLEIGVDISSVKPEKVEDFSKRIKNDISNVLLKNFCYEKEFILTLFSN